MEVSSILPEFKSELSAIVTRRDGRTENLGTISSVIYKPNRWKRLLWRLKYDERGIVTTAGVNYLAADFAGGVSPIGDFKYHDSGEGTNPELIGNIGLQSPCGESRDVAVQSNPTSNSFRTTALHTYAGTFAITEFGLFSASSGITLWDRRLFAVINVVALDGILFTYTCTCTAGGT